MRILIAAILAAGIAGAGCTGPGPTQEKYTEPTEENLRCTYGKVRIINYEKAGHDYIIFVYDNYKGGGIFVVEIRPTPAEMRGE